jgi:hypothetical protein
VIDRAISDPDNQDLQEQAPRRYIVGYLVMQLTEAGEVAEP